MNTALYLDHYELTMAQGYFKKGMHLIPATFDYYFRTPPFQGAFAVFSGTETLINMMQNFRFTPAQCDYLKSVGFDKAFIEYLASFDFQGTIRSVREGEIVFPNEPIVIVEGTLLETQIIETMLLNTLNFESLIATKAARIRNVAGDIPLVDFGLRRAQGKGGIQATRAAIVGGFNKTSNVYAGKKFNINSTGTMAHSWIQSFENEYLAFKAYAEMFPDNTILLVDTFDTLSCGIPNAIKVAWEMEENGQKLKGIRIDSGDLSYLSKKARNILNVAGLHDVSIMVSNQLDENIIQSLIDEKAPVDIFGVGTSMATGQPDAALDGVYKLAEANNQPVMKFSENTAKATLPYTKNVFRYTDADNIFRADAIALKDEIKTDRIYHGAYTEKNTQINKLNRTELLLPLIENGKTIQPSLPLSEISAYRQKRMKQLPEEHKRFINPHEYKVGITKNLRDKKIFLKENIKKIAV